MDTSRNWILAALSTEQYNEILPSMKLVEMALGEQLEAPGESVRSLYFPVSGIVSQLVLLESGETGEVAVIGHEGALGILDMLDRTTASQLCVDVQAQGQAITIPLSVGITLFRAGGGFQQRILRFMRALMLQFAQTAVCNRHHTIEQHFARWLLLMLDRLEKPQNELFMTQEMIANMLGVRREGVNATARRFQSLGIMRYSRGNISILDKPALTEYCCECYNTIRKNYNELL